jgi:membrane protein involved in colicin uptake
LKIAIICAVALAALVTDLMQFQTIKTLRQENEALKQQTAQIAPLQEQVARAAQEASNASGGAQAQETQVRDLARLRGEVSLLRAKTNELAKARQEIAALKQRVASEAEARTSATDALNSQVAAAQAKDLAAAKQKEKDDACVNNLRLIDSAKQQWALEYKKLATDTPALEDLRPYIGRGPNGEMPTCPDGGTYTIGTVGEKPTCSNAAHVLP